MADMIADRIDVDAHRCHGKPVIAGTRVLVRTIRARFVSQLATR